MGTSEINDLSHLGSGERFACRDSDNSSLGNTWQEQELHLGVARGPRGPNERERVSPTFVTFVLTLLRRPHPHTASPVFHIGHVPCAICHSPPPAPLSLEPTLNRVFMTQQLPPLREIVMRCWRCWRCWRCVRSGVNYSRQRLGVRAALRRFQ